MTEALWIVVIVAVVVAAVLLALRRRSGSFLKTAPRPCPVEPREEAPEELTKTEEAPPGDAAEALQLFKYETFTLELRYGLSPLAQEIVVEVSSRELFRCSAFYPEKFGAADVGKIVASVHGESVADKVVREAARRLELPSGVAMKAASEIPLERASREMVIDVTPDVPGLAFDTLRASLALWQDAQSVEFRFKAEAVAVGTACHGWVHFWLEGVILADVPVTIFVAAEDVPEIFREALAAANARPYRLVFPSYSHQDADIVERLETYAASFGDEYLRDVSKLRAGQHWSDELAGFIHRADVFQLFWSQNAAASRYVEQEWRHALEERQARPDPHFVRPVYWTPQPAPIPPELQPLHFARVPLGRG